ncbi:hypothetical protein CsSME_00006177 [Camellia sinensis var. sinensis]
MAKLTPASTNISYLSIFISRSFTTRIESLRLMYELTLMRLRTLLRIRKLM